MERLEPILKQKFWILLGLGILMTITGWWLATGSLAATIKLRTGEVNDAFKNIPTGEIPNNNWSSQLAARNTEQDRAVRYTKALLWERQLSRMTWPESVRPHAWKDGGYRGEIALEGREDYRGSYGNDVRRVWESVRPFMQSDGSGIVFFGADERVLPQRTNWGRLAPSSADMWDAQEDLWLLESLLRAIVDVNGGPTAQRGDASIHVIETLKLYGGQPPAQRKSAASATTGPVMPGGGAASGAHGSSSPPSSGGGFGGGGAPGGTGGPGQTVAIGSADFDPKEEIGDDGSAGASGGRGGAGGAMSMGPTAAHSGGGGAGGAGGAAGGPGAASAANAVRRYVEDDTTLPYKTRAFYITVLMDHRKIPSLVAELTASEKSAWPVEILRIQMVRAHDNDIDSRGGGFGSGSGSSGGLGAMSGSAGGGGRLSLPTGLGTGPTGFPGAGSYDSETSSAGLSNDPLREGLPNPNAVSQLAAATAALEGALQDPFIARVAICGIITLYNEVKPEPVTPAAAQPIVPAPAAGTPAQGTPGTPAADPAATGDPAATSDPAATVPDSVPPAAEGNTPEGTTPAKPEVPASDAPPAKPTPPAIPGAVPAAPPDAPKAPANGNG